MFYRPLVVATALSAGSLMSCKSDRPAAEAAPPTTAAPDDQPVTVTAGDYSMDLPASIPAGNVTLRLVNHGKELHQGQIVRIEDGKTVEDVKEALKSDGPPPAWLKFVGGPNGSAPGQETSSISSLEPGHYAMLCLIPSPDGVSHLAKGMIKGFEVTASTGAAAALPVATDTIRLVEYGFDATRPLSPGRHTILVENGGAQAHELVLLRLAPGKSVKDFATWATAGGMQGPPPAMPMGGVAVMDRNERGVFSVDLGPGNYGLICFVPDAKDGKLHLQHGMMKQITVG
ncbi:MAG: hypothetical protein ABI860_09335 [Gemmatimonadales bacterium]